MTAQYGGQSLVAQIPEHHPPYKENMLQTDAKVKDVSLFLLPVETRVPLKFGSETLLTVNCARAKITLEDRDGNVACGWGETPLSVQWVWPSSVPYTERHAALVEFCKVLAQEWLKFTEFGHPIELSHSFQENVLHCLLYTSPSPRD